MKFETLLSHTSNTPVAFASAGQSYLSRASGEIVRTDNLFDVGRRAMHGSGIQTPAGPGLYPRRPHEDDPDRRVADAQRLAGAGRRQSPILLDPNGGPPRISRDGAITQNNRAIGAIGLFKIDDKASLKRFDNSGVIPDQPATPVVEFSKVGVQQGFMERANVNPVMEMSKLIMVSRAFDAVSSSLTELGVLLARSDQDPRGDQLRRISERRPCAASSNQSP